VTRVAAVDCGTNSLRLLVADLDVVTGQAEVIDRRTTIVRLGQGVDRTGTFAPEALQRTFATIDEYATVIHNKDATAVRFVATSAARDVANRDAFLDGVRTRLGIDAEIITGAEEAALSYDGATRELARAGDAEPPVLVLDIGGGSTELVIQRSEDHPIQGVSLDVGSVRLTERHLTADPPTPAQVVAVQRDVDNALAGLEVPVDVAKTLVGVGGTVTTMGAMVLGLDAYDRDRVNGSRFSRSDVRAAVDEIVAMTVAQRRSLPFMHPDRADVIGAGALVLGCVVDRVGLPELRVSSHDILDGIAWSIAPGRDPAQP
jgi:exopolyphosphatase/guanosine-5'-triphosphate,3'-diphosphate pyrophosphatase